MSLIPIKIFVSSPSDVNPERTAAQRVIERLGREFGGFFAVSAELWEQEPLRATSHFQDQIPRPSEADIVLVIVWSRLGTRLPSQRFKGMLSGDAVTGTEWEFEDAALSFRERGTPDLLFYRKTARIDVALDDEHSLEQRLADRKNLDTFLQKWFFTESAEFKNAFSSFGTTIEFELIVEQHLRKLLQNRLASLEGAEAAEPARWQGGSPFRGLEPFDVEHAAIYYGRSRARMELREALAARARQGTAFVLLLGMSGSGKSSLVRAALIPDLGVPGMIEQVGLFRYAVMHPSGSDAPLTALALALFAKNALPELEGQGWTPSRIAEQLAKAPGSLGAILTEALSVAGAAAGLVPGAKARLLLVIDQLEEMFTSAAIDAAARTAFIEAVAALARSEAVWVVATMRSDMFHHLGTTPLLAELAEGAGQYHLLPPQSAEIAQIIREPATAAGLRFETDPDSNLGLDETLRAAMENDPAALPLLEFTLNELFNARTARGVLTYEAYRNLGGIEGALARRAEDVFSALPEDVQAALPAVAAALVAPHRGEGGGFAARSAPATEFAGDSRRRDLVDAFVAARLFVSDGGDKGGTVRVAHEALFRKWPRMKDILERDAAFVVARERLAIAMERWEGEGKPADFLLPAGRALAEAEEILKTRSDDLDPAIAAFIEASSAAARRRRNRTLRWTQGIAAGFAVIALFAGGAGWFAWQSRLAAEAATVEAVHQRDGALKTESFFLSALSQKSTRAHDAFDGVLLARAALPADLTKPDRPVVPEAREALATALDNLGAQRGVIRHEGAGALAAFVNDHVVASFSNKDGLKLSQVPDGSLLATIGDQVPSAAWFSEDAKRFILAAGETLQFFNGHDRTSTLPLHKTGDALFSTVVDRDMTRAALLYATGDDRVIALPGGHELARFGMGKPVLMALWAGRTGKLIWSDTAGHIVMQTPGAPNAMPLPGVRAEVSAITVTENGDLAAAGVVDGSLHVWSVATGRQIATWQAEKGMVLSLSFSRDGRRLAGQSRDGIATVWEVASGRRLMTVDKLPPHTPMALSPDGQHLAVAEADFGIAIYDVASGTPSAKLAGHAAALSGLQFNASGSVLLSTAKDGTVRLWDIADAPDQVLDAALGPISVMGYTSHGEVYAGDQSGKLALWHGGTLLTADTKLSPLIAAAVDSSGRTAAVSTINGGGFWSLADHRPLPGPLLGKFVMGLSTSPDGTRVLATSITGTAVLFDAQSGKALGQFQTPVTQFVDGGISAGGKLAWLRNGKKIELRRVSDFAPVQSIDAGTFVRKAMIAPNDQTLLDLNLDGSVVLFDIASGKRTAELHAKGTAVQVFAASASGERALVIDAKGVLTVYDVTARRALGTLTLPGAPAKSAILSPDGSVMAVQTGDGAVHVWSVPRFESVMLLPDAWVGDSAAFTPPMAFSPDGKHLAVRWQNNKVRIWPVDRSFRDLVARADRAVPRRLGAQERQQLIQSFN